VEARFFPASLTALEGLREYVLTAAAQTSLDSEQTFKLELAVDEIATNAILYGYQEHSYHGDREKYISIAAEFDDGSLVIILRDQGIAFNPLDRKLPDQQDLNRSLEERTIGGLGIYLAVTGVDRFDHKRQDGVNINTFAVFYKQPSGAAAPSG
jgi:anti-sigma regulatory factor (Ser/Thr protein kinase)